MDTKRSQRRPQKLGINKYILWRSILFLSFNNFYGQVLMAQPFQSITVVPSKYSNDHCEEKLKRKDKNLVVISFFNVVNDTIELYIDKERKFKKYISIDSNIISTSYTGISYAVNLSRQKENIIIISKNEKLKINVPIDRKYPLYMISKVGGDWSASPRKCFPGLK